MRNASRALALVDFVPNILYLAGSVGIAGSLSRSGEAGLARMMLVGAALAFVAGCLKAASKLRDAMAGRPVSESGFLYDQMFPSMALGFLATTVSLILFARQGAAGQPATPWAPGLSYAVHGATLFLLAGLLAFAAAANAPAAVSRPAFRRLARMAMAAMIILELGSLGILAWLAFRSGPAPAGVLLILSIASMLAMGALGSPSMKGRFSDPVAMNWVDEGVNSLGQALYAAAAFLILLG
jgi:hypothetical protein